MAVDTSLHPLACPPFNPLDPNLSPQKNNERYKHTFDWRDCTGTTIWRFRKMKGAVRKMLEKYGKTDQNTLTDEEVAEYAIERAHIKAAAGKAERRESYDKQVLRVDTIATRLKKYQAQYIVETANDMASLRQLCVLELNMERLERIQDGLMESLEKKEEVSEVRINSIVRALQQISSEYRQYQDMLGIDKATREKREAEKGGAEYLRNLMKQASDLLTEKSVKITCDKCEEKGTVLQMGFILSHFGDWVWEGYCPKCGERLRLEEKHKRAVAL